MMATWGLAVFLRWSKVCGAVIRVSAKSQLHNLQQLATDDNADIGGGNALPMTVEAQKGTYHEMVIEHPKLLKPYSH